MFCLASRHRLPRNMNSKKIRRQLTVRTKQTTRGARSHFIRISVEIVHVSSLHMFPVNQTFRDTMYTPAMTGKFCISISLILMNRIEEARWSRSGGLEKLFVAGSLVQLIAQIFVCDVTRSTNAEGQHNDMVMWTNVQMI